MNEMLDRPAINRPAIDFEATEQPNTDETVGERVKSRFYDITGNAWQYIDRWDATMRSKWPFRTMVVEVDPEDAAMETPFRLLVRSALLGFLAICAISVGSSLPASPYTLKLPGAWFFGVPAAGSILPQGTLTPGLYTHGSGSPLLSLVLVYGGLVVFMRVWYGMVRTLSRRPNIPVVYLVAVFALWVLPLLIAPPIFSRDIYSYVAQGDMVTHHISPYRYGPFVLGGDHYSALVDPIWGNVPAPYGPLFLILDGGATILAFHNLIMNVVFLRLLALGGVALMAAFIPYLARSLKRDPAEIFVLAILNPVTIFHLIGGSHNDAIMLGLLVAGVAVARKGHPIGGIILCTMAAAVKVPAALGVVYIGFEWAKVRWNARETMPGCEDMPAGVSKGEDFFDPTYPNGVLPGGMSSGGMSSGGVYSVEQQSLLEHIEDPVTVHANSLVRTSDVVGTSNGSAESEAVLFVEQVPPSVSGNDSYRLMSWLQGRFRGVERIKRFVEDRLRVNLKRLVLAALLSFGVMEAFTLVSGFGWSWVASLLTPGTVRSWLAPATGIGMLLAGLAHLLGLSIQTATLLSLTRAAGLLAAAFLAIRWLLHRDSIGIFKAMGMTFLVIVAMGPVVQPWYLSWGIIFLALSSQGRLRSIVIAVSVATAFIGLPGAHHLLKGLFHMDPLALAATLTLLLAALTVPLTPTKRRASADGLPSDFNPMQDDYVGLVS
jgi:hypothetical protein